MNNTNDEWGGWKYPTWKEIDRNHKMWMNYLTKMAEERAEDELIKKLKLVKETGYNEIPIQIRVPKQGR